MRPKPPLIEQRALPEPGRGGGFLRPLAAGVIGGLASAGIVYLALGGNSGADADTQQKIKDLQERAAVLSETVQAKVAAPVKAASPEELNEVRSRLDGLDKTVKGVDETMQSLSQKVQAVEQKPAPEPGKDVIQAEIASQIAPIAEQLAGLEHSQTERVSDSRTATLAFTLTNLKRAVAEGKPFAAELAAVENLSPAKLPVSELAPYKDSGVPTLQQLQRDFAEISGNVIQKHYHGKANSIVGEVLSRARAAIQVRPKGSAGDTVEAVLGRMDSALKAGDLKGALTGAAALEGPAKDELQTWLEHARARAAADEAIRKTDQELLASLTKTPTQ